MRGDDEGLADEGGGPDGILRGIDLETDGGPEDAGPSGPRYELGGPTRRDPGELISGCRSGIGDAGDRPIARDGAEENGAGSAGGRELLHTREPAASPGAREIGG